MQLTLCCKTVSFASTTLLPLRKCAKEYADKDMHVLQATTNQAYNEASESVPAQLVTLVKSGFALNSQNEVSQVGKFRGMLSALLHPEAKKRMTSMEMLQLQWLQDAAAVPFPDCPLHV